MFFTEFAPEAVDVGTGNNTAMDAIYTPCSEEYRDVYEFKQGVIGLFDVVQGLVRLNAALLTTHVADFFRMMIIVVVVDLGYVYVTTRYMYKVGELHAIPVIYWVLFGASIMYDIYVLYWARRAHNAKAKREALLKKAD